MKTKNIIFVSRAALPAIGGKEKYASELLNNLNNYFNIFQIQNKIFIGNFFNKISSPFFLIYSFFVSLFLIYYKKVNIIIFSDCALAPLGVLIKKTAKDLRIYTVAHGLDITYNNFFYQRFVAKYIKDFDLVIANSENTKNICQKKQIKKVITIPCGMDVEKFVKKLNKTNIDIVNKYPQLKNKKKLLSVGHLVERKGFFWFAENVMPLLGDEYYYVVIGGYRNKNGVQKRGEIEKNNKLKNKVLFLGEVSDEVLFSFYNFRQVKAFIMPNIKVDNNVEGFGIVAIEAAVAGIPVIASNIEGMKTSVIDKKTGLLVEERNPDRFFNAIKHIDEIDRDKTRQEIINNFSWEVIIKRWEEVINNRIK